MSSPTAAPAITLNDATRIPQLGFGVFQVPPGDTQAVVEQALATGYRHIDTAQSYGNEEGVGAAVAASGLPRDEVFVTTKLANRNHLPKDVQRSAEESLQRLGMARIDLFLIHWPVLMHYDGDISRTWEALIELRENGLVGSIGVSNFEPAHLDTIISDTRVVPSVNHVEVHPFFGNSTVREANRSHGIVTEAWAPIAKGQVGQDATLTKIADDTGATAAQVALRWHLELGHVVFPKTARPERMSENFEALNLTLTATHMEQISRLDQGEAGRTGPHPDTFDLLI